MLLIWMSVLKGQGTRLHVSWTLLWVYVIWMPYFQFPICLEENFPSSFQLMCTLHWIVSRRLRQSCYPVLERGRPSPLCRQTRTHFRSQWLYQKWWVPLIFKISTCANANIISLSYYIALGIAILVRRVPMTKHPTHPHTLHTHIYAM